MESQNFERYWHVAVNHKYLGSAPQDILNDLTHAVALVEAAKRAKKLRAADFEPPHYIHYVSSPDPKMSVAKRIDARLIFAPRKSRSRKVEVIDKPKSMRTNPKGKAFLAPKRDYKRAQHETQ